MKRYVKSPIMLNHKNIPEENIIRITMYLHPTIYDDSEVILGSLYYDESKRRYSTDVNPYREINGPLSNYGEELEPPIKSEYESFILDCVDAIEDEGFTIIKRYTSTDSNKSEYIILYGVGDEPFVYLIYDLRISDHPFDATFPEDLKDEVLEYLQMNKILDESATKAGINFAVEKVTVGSVKHDTWSRALGRSYDVLSKMKRRINNVARSRKKS